MGWFRRAASTVNERGSDVINLPGTLAYELAPSVRRAAKLEARGTPANGVITGIKFSFNDESTRKEFAVTLTDGPASGQRYGVQIHPQQGGHRLRLGVPVVLKVEGSRGIVDWSAMATAWGLPESFVPQEAMRTPPDDGVTDTALDMRVLRRLKKGTPARAIITSFTRRTTLGMLTDNWDIELTLPDGTTTTSPRDNVPSYARWFVAPGAEAPIAIDPKDAAKASIDWPAFAIERFDAVGFDDDPIVGSIAADIEGSTVPTTAALSTPPPGLPPAPAGPGAGVALDATMLSWVDTVRSGNMTTKDFERAIGDWQTAGMCTAAQVDAARVAAQA